MKIEGNKIEAEEGYVLQRILDSKIFGKELYLGFNYWLKKELIADGYKELPEHYREIPEPLEENN